MTDTQISRMMSRQQRNRKETIVPAHTYPLHNEDLFANLTHTEVNQLRKMMLSAVTDTAALFVYVNRTFGGESPHGVQVATALLEMETELAALHFDLTWH